MRPYERRKATSAPKPSVAALRWFPSIGLICHLDLQSTPRARRFFGSFEQDPPTELSRDIEPRPAQGKERRLADAASHENGCSIGRRAEPVSQRSPYRNSLTWRVGATARRCHAQRQDRRRRTPLACLTGRTLRHRGLSGRPSKGSFAPSSPGRIITNWPGRIAWAMSASPRRSRNVSRAIATFSTIGIIR